MSGLRFLLVALVLLSCVWVLWKWGPRSRGVGAAVRVEGWIRLDRCVVAVIEADGRRFLVVAGERGGNLIAELGRDGGCSGESSLAARG